MTTITSSNAFVTQPVADVLYILVDNAQTFEAIRAPEIESFMGERRCRAKAGLWNGIDVVFQFWVKGEETE